MSSRKREHEEASKCFIESPTKKQKSNDKYVVDSTFFKNEYDHKQFQELFSIIDSSKLLTDLLISEDIIKEIAEYHRKS